MNFEESVKYLYGLGNEVLAMKLGLESIGKLLDALVNPQRKYLKVQIAGTNGKGSTVAFLEAICLQAGIKVGATTSPHLVSITERVRIGGSQISETDFARHATIVKKMSEKLVAAGELKSVPTYFEQVTAIALNAFAESGVDLAILETGLGGRFDATTAARAHIVALTPIDYDHQRILGDTLTEIAAEKAAIIRADTRVLSAPQKKEAENVIYGKCRESGVAPIWAIPKVELIENLGGGLLYLNFKTNESSYKTDFGMQGRHQWTNAALAIYIAENLRDFGLKISQENIETGLETARHKGRLEFFGGILFDGAHNLAGAKALREYLQEFHENDRITMIYGTMKDKQIAEVAEILFPLAENLILTEPDNLRTMPVGEIEKIASRYIAADKIVSFPDVAEAISAAREISSIHTATKRSLILVTGSLYLVGEAQKILSED